MRNRTIATMLVAAFVSFTLADAASAYYSPRLGRFLGRDPIGEPGATLVRTGSRPTEFIPRDPLPGHGDPNGYTAVMNDPPNLVDPDGMAPTPMPPPWDRPAPAGTDCGVDVLQTPLCFLGSLGHTWLTWGDGSKGNTSDLPEDHIHRDANKCQNSEEYIAKKWHTRRRDGMMWTGSEDPHSGKPCSLASCSDITTCLHQYMEHMAETHGGTIGYNCRTFADDALTHCCLDVVTPPYKDEWDKAIKAFCCSPCGKRKTGGLH